MFIRQKQSGLLAQPHRAFLLRCADVTLALLTVEENQARAMENILFAAGYAGLVDDPLDVATTSPADFAHELFLINPSASRWAIEASTHFDPKEIKNLREFIAVLEA